MASPTASTSGDDQKKMEQITFRFCSECSNMLYPKEDPDTHRLQFACRTCQYSELATSTCVFRNILNNAVGETAGVTQDVGSDPTVWSRKRRMRSYKGRLRSYERSVDVAEDELPRSNKTCPKCKVEDAVFFQSQQRSAETGMKLFYVCCGCGHIFS